jgi:tetratricopeptide (TPR) repeat protein
MFLRLGCLVLWLAVCAGFSGCTPLPELPQDEQKNPYYRTAKERLQRRDFQGAIEAFDKAIHLNPNAVMAHFELALVYQQHEFDYASAIYHYNKVLKLRPTGHPADNARVGIRICKQELAKSEAMGSLVPSLPLQFEKLREENERLNRLVATQRMDIALLQAQLTAVRAVSPAGTPGNADASRQGPVLTGGHLPTRTATPARAPAGASRLHKVRERETLAAIARQYGVRLEALQAANPSINPRRLKPGQTVVVPSP